MKAQEIKEQLKAEGLWDEDKQWIIDKMTDIEDLASDILSSQSDNRFQLEFEPDFFHKQQGRIKSNLHKIDGTSIYFTIQDFRVNFNKDFETHCQKHGIDDKRGFLTGLKDAYDFVLSEYESVSENALLLTYKEKDCFGLDESEIKGYADKKAQTLLYHLEAIIKEIEDRIKDIDERADAIISNSLSSPAPEDDAQSLPPNPIKTKADILKEQLSQYGFFELEKVKTLSEQSKVSIIEKIAKSGLPYAIAMFDYLGFIQYLEDNHFDTKYKLNRKVSKWFNSDEEGRAVKGNISSLLKNTTENKSRYTAYKHKENVIKDYELLK